MLIGNNKKDVTPFLEILPSKEKCHYIDYLCMHLLIILTIHTKKFYHKHQNY